MSNHPPEESKSGEKPDAPLTPMASAGYASVSPAKPSKMRQWRGVKDGTSKHIVGTGGISVIIALGLIFVYLAWEVVPLFYPATATEAATSGSAAGAQVRPRRFVLGIIDARAVDASRCDRRH